MAISDYDDKAMGYFSTASGVGGGAMPYNSVTGWSDNPAERAQWACGLVKTTAGVVSAGLNAGVPGAGTAFAIGVGVVTDAVTFGLAAHDTQKTIAELKKLHDHVKTSKPKLASIIEYCIAKRSSKFKRQVSRATGVGAGVSIFEGVKAIHKIRTGTKGVNRNLNAGEVYAMAEKGDKDAEKLIAIIAGGNFKSLMIDAIKQGMKSTA